MQFTLMSPILSKVELVCGNLEARVLTPDYHQRRLNLLFVQPIFEIFHGNLNPPLPHIFHSCYMFRPKNLLIPLFTFDHIESLYADPFKRSSIDALFFLYWMFFLYWI
ncbi:hypothetical protein KP509_14G049400 [Ceratopteris richardii]|uniref:Uncharacterized protein n=1 Tax=Ceratopteris richardii TaxID=49495 RepID=A0A8T2TCR3_CERRI|nr:hypothetical protein KP509_14G049400 [Ceratopteris richardii]